MRIVRWLVGSLLALSLILFGLSCGGDDGPNGPNDSAPSASFTVTPASGGTETAFQFDASSSSDAQDSLSFLQVRWNWENDGTWDTDWSTTKTVSHTYATTGTKTIKLEVKDSGGLTDDTTRTVTVTGSPPAPDDMVLVPAGTFTMGSDPGEQAYDYELPEHHPYISAFYIDKYEVTNTRYAQALNWAISQDLVSVSFPSPYGAVRSTGPGQEWLLLMDDSLNFNNRCRITYVDGSFGVEAGWESHPVVSVTWYGAAEFCNWRSAMEGRAECYSRTGWACDFNVDGYRLPTEAEWEKTARGNEDERTYPWGETIDCDRCDYNPLFGECAGTTVEVDDPAYLGGGSPYGAFHMAGNVWEWVNDWFTGDDYTSSPASDPTGPASGLYRMKRGGSWFDAEGYARCANRTSYGIAQGEQLYTGFRTVLRP